MAESSGWVSSPKQRSPQFEHLDSVIRRSLRLSINISMGTKQQVSYLITAWMAAKIFLVPHAFGTCALRRGCSPVAATVSIRPWFLRGLENESELLATHAPVLIDQSQKQTNGSSVGSEVVQAR
jgi:hypothetical protein